MPLKTYDRVTYDNNPLTEVLCEFKFDTATQGTFEELLSSTNTATIIHSSVRESFPQFGIGKNLHIQIDQASQKVREEEEPLYQFRSEDSNTLIELSKTSIVITTLNYENWKDFSDSLYYFIENGLLPILTPLKLSMNRVGLRYKNIIQRKLLGFSEQETWTNLINPILSGCYGQSDISEDIIGGKSHLAINLPEPNEKLLINHALVKHSESGEICYLIDSDCIHEGAIDYGDTRELLDRHNDNARNFFQWAITKPLHKKLKPRQSTHS